MKCFSKIIVLILSLAFVFSLSSCGVPNGDSEFLYNSTMKSRFSSKYEFYRKNNEFYLIDLDTNEKIPIYRDAFRSVNLQSSNLIDYFFDGDYFYYSISDRYNVAYATTGNKGNISVYRLNLKTFQDELLYYETDVPEPEFLQFKEPEINKFDFMYFFVVQNTMIYVDSVGIHSVDLFTKNKTLLIEDGVNMQYFSYYKNIIYYINGKKELMTFNLATKKCEKLFEPRASSFMITSKYILFSSCSDGGKLYRADLDGGNILQLTDKCAFSFVEDNGVIYAVVTETQVKDILSLKNGTVYKMDINGDNKAPIANDIAIVEYSFDSEHLIGKRNVGEGIIPELQEYLIDLYKVKITQWRKINI